MTAHKAKIKGTTQGIIQAKTNKQVTQKVGGPVRDTTVEKACRRAHVTY